MDALIRKPRTIEPEGDGEKAADLPDDALVALAIDGESEAFDELASRHRQLALRTASAIVGRDEAEDVVQDALLLAFRALPTIRDRTKFSRWLSTITRFRALRFARSESRLGRGVVQLDAGLLGTLSDLACSPRESEAGDELLRDSLSKIPVAYAEVIRLHFLHGLPHQRIAGLLDVPLSTVKWRCCRGKELLRSVLENGGAGVRRLGHRCVNCEPEGVEGGCSFEKKAASRGDGECGQRAARAKARRFPGTLLPARQLVDAS